MPVNINLDHITESIELDECYEGLLDSKFNPHDQDSFQTVAPLLKKLNNNKYFGSCMLCHRKKACNKPAG